MLRAALASSGWGTAAVNVTAAVVLTVGAAGAARSHLFPATPPAAARAGEVLVGGAGEVPSVVDPSGEHDGFLVVPGDTLADGDPQVTAEQLRDGLGFLVNPVGVLAGLVRARVGLRGGEERPDRVEHPLAADGPADADLPPGPAEGPSPAADAAGEEDRPGPALAPLVPAEDSAPEPAPAPTPAPPPAANPPPAQPVPAQPQLGVAQFLIAGVLSGLHPGGSGALVLTLTNPHPFDIDVVTLGVVPGSPPAGCTTASGSHPIRTGGVGLGGPPVRVPAGGSTTHELVVRMSASASDGCQGKRFPLRYEGKAVRR